MIGFPLGSKVLGLGSDGLPLYSNPYKSEQLREVNKQFFSQGVFGQEAMRVAMRPKPGNTFVSTDSIYVVVTDGCANVDGAFGIVKETGDIGMLTTTAASSSHTYVERHHVIGVRLNKGTGDETIEIFTESSADLYSSSSWNPSVSRDDSTYEIVLATVTSKSTYSNGNVTYNWILDDYRLDNYYCGLATGLITLDTTQFQQEMNDEISSYRAVIAAIQENADESMQELNEAIQNAIDLSNAALDGSLAGDFDDRITALEDEMENLEPSACPFPVGFVMTLINDVNPQTWYPSTTWEKIEGKFLLSSSSSYNVGATGGEATHTLSSAEMPSHKHSVGAHSHGLNGHTHSMSHYHTANAIGFKYEMNSTEAWSALRSTTRSNYYPDDGVGNRVSDSSASTTGGASGNTANSSAFDSGSTGSGNAHNNMPPYLVVTMWKRTA